MCARIEIFFNNKKASEYQKALQSIELSFSDSDVKEGFPSQRIPVITAKGVEDLLWGIPLERKLVINARCESVLTKPMFRDAFRTARVLVPVNAYFEWDKQKTKYRFASASPMALAAVRSGEFFSILTRDSIALTMQVHDRMPVIIDPASFQAYLNGDPMEALALTQEFQGPIDVRPMTPQQLSFLD